MSVLDWMDEATQDSYRVDVAASVDESIHGLIQIKECLDILSPQPSDSPEIVMHYTLCALVRGQMSCLMALGILLHEEKIEVPQAFKDAFSEGDDE